MKKGFTLIEVTAVVLILALLAIFVVPKVTSIINNNKAKACNSIVKSAEEAAKVYTYMHTQAVDDAITLNGHFDVTIGELQTQGLLKKDIENPYNGDNIPATNTVRITKSGNNYTYTYMGGECE